MPRWRHFDEDSSRWNRIKVTNSTYLRLTESPRIKEAGSTACHAIYNSREGGCSYWRHCATRREYCAIIQFQLYESRICNFRFWWIKSFKKGKNLSAKETTVKILDPTSLSCHRWENVFLLKSSLQQVNWNKQSKNKTTHTRCVLKAQLLPKVSEFSLSHSFV